MNQNMVNEQMKTAFDISREFDIPFNKVLNDLDKLRKSLEGEDDLMETLIYYYKSKTYGMD